MSPAGLMTLDEVAAMLKVSPRHIRNLMANGDLAGINIGTGNKSVWRFEPVELGPFIERRRMFNGNLPVPATVKRRRATPISPVIDFTAAKPPGSERPHWKRRAHLPPANISRRPKP